MILAFDFYDYDNGMCSVMVTHYEAGYPATWDCPSCPMEIEYEVKDKSGRDVTESFSELRIEQEMVKDASL